MLDDESFTTRDRRLPVHGVVDERFRGVLDAYLENFDRDSELGSAVSVVVEGETVVDIWGGWIDEERSR